MIEPNIEALLAQLGGDQSTNMQLLTQLLSAQSQPPPYDEYAESNANPAVRQPQDRAFQILRELNRDLSMACGACTCWGRHKSCSRCHGEGGPGHTDPDPERFRAYIEPVLWRLGLMQKDLQPNK